MPIVYMTNKEKAQWKAMRDEITALQAIIAEQLCENLRHVIEIGELKVLLDEERNYAKAMEARQ